MSQNNHSKTGRGNGNSKSTRYAGSVPKRQPASTKAFTACRSLNSARDVIDFLGLTLAEVGSEYGRITGQSKISKQAVYKIIAAPRLTDNMLQVLGQLLSNKLTRLCGLTCGIELVQNSPLHVYAYLPCATCHRLYRVDRAGVLHCPDCRG